MNAVEIYTKSWCVYCRLAKLLLDKHRITYREVDVISNSELEKEMVNRAERHTVPQIFIDGSPIGGFMEPAQLAMQGKLNQQREPKL